MRYSTTALIACALLTCTAFADDSKTSPHTNSAPDATIDLSADSVAAGIGYVWGHGDLAYKGRKLPFKLSGVSVVDVGAASISATGEVYNLQNLNDFSGNYATVTAGLTVGGGGSVAVLRNEHGVVIKLQSTTAGLRFNLSADGVDIKLQKS
jgi:hypothetical protein